MHRALIFCAGNGTRWKLDTPKQMVEVEGEVLLWRTVGQLSKRGWLPIVVSDDERIYAPGYMPYKPENSEYFVDSVLSTRGMWKGNMLCVLGDVFFTEDAMDTVTSTEGLHWFGRHSPSQLTGGPGEVFAVSWNEESRDRFERSLVVAGDHARENPDVLLPGSPWQPYRHLIDVPLQEHAVRNDGIWVEINDWTDDFDTVARYKNWCRRYKKRFV